MVSRKLSGNLRWRRVGDELFEDGKIRRIQGVNVLDAGLMPSGGQDGIEDALPAKLKLVHPSDPLLGNGGILRDEGNLRHLAPIV